MSQKIENILNLALEATPGERERSGELEVGFDPEEDVWELIVKYSGTLDTVRSVSLSVTELMNGYAVIVIREDRIEELASFPEVEFIEKPKSLYFEAYVGRQVSCIDSVQNPPYSLKGNGILIGIVDSGIDYANPAFRNADGTTRIVSLWDQTIPGNPPEGYATGTEYTREDINAALAAQEDINVAPDTREDIGEAPAVREDSGRSGGLQGEEERFRIVPSRDISGHGTAVAGIAAGNGAGSTGGQYRGVAPEAELIVVKMGIPRTEGFPRTTELMTGVDYIIRKALELKTPVAVNISFGNTYGSHDGTSLVERFLNDISDTWKNVICVGSGNEGTTAGHAAGRLTDEEERSVEFAVQDLEPALNLQIWKSYVDEVDISVVNPSGVRVGPFREILGPQRFVLGGTELLIYYGEPKPYSVKQEIYLSFIPRQSYIDSGVWQIVLTPRRIVEGDYQMWLPAQAALNVGTAFLLPNSDSTLTIPSTASLVVTVAAYDARTFSYADFSGRGPASVYEGSNVPKPDLAAPGVQVTAPVPGGSYREFSGTSFATPFVTGGAALLMEWGIVRGNDPYLYGEKVKAYLRRGARELPGYEQWPNAQLGYGALCVRDSLPGE